MLSLRVALLLGVLLVPPAIQADTYMVTRTTANGVTSEAKLYRKGDWLRLENAGRQTFTLVDRTKRITTILDPLRREYMPLDTSPNWVVSLAMWLQRPLTPKGSGVTVHQRYELRDTGERRVAFGHAVKHLRSVEEIVAPPGACLSSSRTERDGWYFAEDSKDGEGRFFARLVLGSSVCADTVVADGPRPRLGFPVSEDVSAFGMTLQRREVAEFSEAPLDPELFQVPAGYQKVDRMPFFPSQNWSDRMASDWSMLAAAVQSWFP